MWWQSETICLNTSIYCYVVSCSFRLRVNLFRFPTHNDLCCAPVHRNHGLIAIENFFRIFCEFQIINYFFQQCKVFFVHSNINHPGSSTINIIRFSICEVVPFLEVVIRLISRSCFSIKAVRLLALLNNALSKCFHSEYG